MVKRFALGMLLAVIFSPAFAFAHGMHIFANVEGEEIHGQAEFHDDAPVEGATVTATDHDGAKLGETKTDAEGKFVLKVEHEEDVTIHVETPDGHGGEYVVHAEELAGHGHSHPDDDPGHAHAEDQAHDHDADEELHTEIVALRKQLADHDSAIRIRDVIGGIGYILGIAGVAFYLLGSRQKQ